MKRVDGFSGGRATEQSNYLLCSSGLALLAVLGVLSSRYLALSFDSGEMGTPGTPLFTS